MDGGEVRVNLGEVAKGKLPLLAHGSRMINEEGGQRSREMDTM